MSDQTGVSLPSWQNNGEVLFKVSNGRVIEARVICLDEKKVWTTTDADDLLSESMAQVDGAPIENRKQVENGAHIEKFTREYETIDWDKERLKLNFEDVADCIDKNWMKLKKHKSVLDCRHHVVRKGNQFVRLTTCTKFALKFRSFRRRYDSSTKMVSPEDKEF